MFEQSLLEATGRGTKTWPKVIVSSFLQLLLVCGMILVPLIYTNVLPATVLRQTILAPAPPPGPPPPKVIRVVDTKIKRELKVPDKLYQPPVIPKDIPTIDEPETPPFNWRPDS